MRRTNPHRRKSRTQNPPGAFTPHNTFPSIRRKRLCHSPDRNRTAIEVAAKQLRGTSRAGIRFGRQRLFARFPNRDRGLHFHRVSQAERCDAFPEFPVHPVTRVGQNHARRYSGSQCPSNLNERYFRIRLKLNRIGNAACASLSPGRRSTAPADRVEKRPECSPAGLPPTGLRPRGARDECCQIGLGDFDDKRSATGQGLTLRSAFHLPVSGKGTLRAQSAKNAVHRRLARLSGVIMP